MCTYVCVCVSGCRVHTRGSLLDGFTVGMQRDADCF